MSSSSNRSVVIWLLTGCFLIAAMVVIGGITRLTHSGLSMVDWKLFMGAIPPLNEAEWQETFEQYKQFPEYKKMHYYFTLEDFKSIFMWEYIHRLLGRLIGLVFLIPFVVFWLRGAIQKSLIPKLILIFVWGGFQGFLGWYMVKSGLVDNPNVSHYRLAIHLVTAFGLCCYIFWVALGLMYPKTLKTGLGDLKVSAWLLGTFTFLQIIYGAFVAGLKAGFVHTTWPKMSSYWIDPVIGTAFEMRGIAALWNDAITIQFIHRWVAFAVLAFVLLIIFKSRMLTLNANQVKARNYLLIAVSLQIVLGVLTLIMAVPILLGVLHQLVALFLLLSIVFFLFHLSRKESGTTAVE